MNYDNLYELVKGAVKFYHGLNASYEILETICEHIMIMYEDQEIPPIYSIISFEYRFIPDANLAFFKEEFGDTFEIVGKYQDSTVIYIDSGSL